LVKQPRETEILGFALQVYFPKIGDSMLVASNEVTLLFELLKRDVLGHVRSIEELFENVWLMPFSGSLI
jgi:hypothetical protein